MMLWLNGVWQGGVWAESGSDVKVWAGEVRAWVGNVDRPSLVVGLRLQQVAAGRLGVDGQ